MNDIAQRIAALPPEKRAILEASLKRSKPTQTGIQPQPRDSQTFPLSYAQQRVWVMEQLAPGSPLYLIPTALRLRGPLDQTALHTALSGLVERHEALRTTFAAPGGKAAQTIQAAQPVALPLHDLSALPANEREAAVAAELRAAAAQPFDLGRDVLLRAALLRCAADEHVLLVTLHHIAADGWSLDVLMRELGALYAAAAHAADVRLPALAIQYADYAVWQQQWLSADAPGTPRATQLSYWQQQLRPEGTRAPTVLELPSDRPRPAVPSYRGATEEWLLPPALTTALTGFCQREGVTKFMTLLAAWNALLYRYSGQTDLLIGTPVANRVRQETEGLIGFFANTLVLRTQVEGTLSGRELLGRVKQTALDAYANQDVPFEMVLDAVQPERHASHSPLFQVAFALRNDSMQSTFEYQGLHFEPLATDSGTAKFDLTLSLTEFADQRISASLEYNTDLFDAATITRMLGHYETLLSALLADATQPVAQMPLLSAAERRQLLDEFTATARPYPADQPVHCLVEAQAARTPDAVAVVAGGTTLRYVELNRAANQLAHWLRAQGVGRETLVGVCLERSPRLIVALLAILKAGGAYLPLDPSYPAERLQFMLHDGAVPVLLAETALRDVLPTSAATVLCLDQAEAMLSTQPSDDLPNLNAPTDLAYVIYTSGSTGQPKGVMVPHRAINRLVCNTNYIALTAQDVVAQVANSAFDAATFEIWGALLTGARLAIITKDIALSPHEFAAQIRQDGVTAMFLTTALFNQLARTVPGIFATVEHLLFGGEACDPRRVREVLQHQPPRRLVHVYGPTETTTFATWHLIEHVAEGATTIPIGRALANDQVYVLDQSRQLVPIGVVGELYIGGAGIAHGYLNRPELTAERFVRHPFSNDPAARLYKTGDLVRCLHDGSIEYIGRIDHQVKLRGFRIELGEIETALSQHPDIHEVTVLVREDVPGDKRLVAYFVPQPNAAGETIGGATLRSFLRERLPDYMVPSALIALPVLPLTPNGKVDRKALPAPDANAESLEHEYVAPRNPTEQTLAEIWAAALGRASVGVHDNFYDLGGDSIISIQIIARAGELGLALTPKQMIQSQTIAELASHVGTTAISAEQEPTTGLVPLTPVQRWFFAQELPDPQHYNQAFLLQVHQPLDLAVLEATAQHLIQQHDALRFRFTRAADGWQQTAVAYTMQPVCTRIDLGAVADAALAEAIEAAATDAQTSLDLAEGPLLRMVYMDLGSQRPGRLLIVIHHLVVDGVSWRILLEALQTAYDQQRQGQPVRLPRKTTSFQHWSQRLAAYAQSPALTDDLRYWQTIGQAAVAALPVDLVGGHNSEASARTISLSLDAEETRALLQHVPAIYHTQINDVLLTALLRACGPWTGAESLLVTLEGHGREAIADDLDLSRTVGWFTSMFPVLLRLDAAASTGDALESIKTQLRRVPQKGLSYGVLRYLHNDPAVAAQLAALPQAEISFNYLGQFSEDPAAAIFTSARESAGPDHSPRAERAHLLDVVGSVVAGQLQLDWMFSSSVHHADTIATLAQAFMAELRAIIGHCRTLASTQPAQSAATGPQLPPGDTSLLVSFNTSGSKAPFFCVHPSDGTVYCFVELARALGPDQPFYAIQAPGVDDAHEPFRNLSAMAGCYIAQMRAVQPDGPYLIGGWSMGGVVAFEMAQQLRSQGQAVPLVAILDAGRDLHPQQRAMVRRMLAVTRDMPQRFSLAGVQQLGLGDQLEHLLSSARTAEVELELDQLTGKILKVLSAHGQARIAYRPQPYAGTVTLFRADDQSFVEGDDSSAPQRRIHRRQHGRRAHASYTRRRRSARQHNDPTMRWGVVAEGGVEIHDIPGNHLSMLKSPNVQVLAAALEQALEQAACDLPYELLLAE